MMKSSGIIKKCFSVVLGILVILLILEMILRVSGCLYFFLRRDRQMIERLNDGKSKYAILCLGESFTYGGELDPKYSYPRQLQDIFDKRNPGANVLVVNGGICEYNSSQVLENLLRNIRKYKPKLIVLLVGSSNRFNFIGFSQDSSIISESRQFVYRLRVYKLFKIAALNLRQKLFEMRVGKEIDKISGKLERYAFLDAIDPDKHILEDIADENHDLIVCLRRLGDEKSFLELFKKYTGEHQDPYLLQYQVSEFMEDIYGGTNKDSKTILSEMQKKLKEAPDLKDNKNFFFYYYLFFKKMKDIYSDERIDNWLRNDLEKIAEICRKNNIKLVLQEYPYPYPDANAVLRKIAEKYSLPLVRNGKGFGELIMKEGKKRYFLDDSHCTAAGYGVMAKNVYEVIEPEVSGKRH